MKNANSPRLYPFLVVAVLLTGVAGCGWMSWSRPSVRPAPAFADDALEGYLPADAGAVYTLDVRRILAAPSGRRLAGPLRSFLDREKGDHAWIDGLGADPMKDIDWAQFLFCPPDLNRPLVLLRGRFRLDPGRLHEASDGPYSYYEVGGPPPAAAAAAALAPVGDTLAVSESRPRFLAALHYAAAPHPVELQDARLRELLRQVDRDQGAWLAVSFDKLGPVPRLADLGLETVLRPVLRHAESVRGGVAFDEDVHGEFVFHARTDADAKELEQDLNASCTVAQGAYLIPGLDPSLLPLLAFIGTGTTARDGRDVTLRCRLPADRISP